MDTDFRYEVLTGDEERVPAQPVLLAMVVPPPAYEEPKPDQWANRVRYQHESAAANNTTATCHQKNTNPWTLTDFKLPLVDEKSQSVTVTMPHTKKPKVRSNKRMFIGFVGTITILVIVAAAILGAFYLGVKVTQDTQKEMCKHILDKNGDGGKHHGFTHHKLNFKDYQNMFPFSMNDIQDMIRQGFKGDWIKPQNGEGLDHIVEA